MRVAFRVDASSRIGSGHLMRCTALADMLTSRGATARFVSHELPAHLRRMLLSRGHEIADIDISSDAEQTAAALAGAAWDWLVVDHYGLDAAWETRLRTRAARVLVIDDLADRPHDCDVLLDQNMHPQMNERYAGKVPPSCELLLGPGYALLRDEFRRGRPSVSARTGRVRRVLVSYGGADADNYTEPALQAVIESRGDAAVDVVIPAGHARQQAIEALCGQHGFDCHVQTERMAELMAAADLALGAAGSTIWEWCCMGVPALAVAAAANQHEVAQEAARQGLVYLAGWSPTLAVHLQALLQNDALREMLSRNGMRAVDGRGAERVARILDGDAIELREATFADARSLHEWRNDEQVRDGARRPDPIQWPEHETWLRATLARHDRILLIGERHGVPVGVVRLDVAGSQAEISLYRVPHSSGSGVGASLMRAAYAWLRERRPDLDGLTACVMGANDRSHHMLRSTGWVLHSTNYTKRLRPS